MSTENKLSEPQFYHGTADEFAPGSVIDPGQPHGSNFGVSGPGRAYFTSDREEAASWARSAARRTGGKPAVYQVQPAGAWEHDRPGGQTAYSTRHPLRVTGVESAIPGRPARERLVSTLGEPMRKESQREPG